MGHLVGIACARDAAGSQPTLALELSRRKMAFRYHSNSDWVSRGQRSFSSSSHEVMCRLSESLLMVSSNRYSSPRAGGDGTICNNGVRKCEDHRPLACDKMIASPWKYFLGPVEMLARVATTTFDRYGFCMCVHAVRTHAAKLAALLWDALRSKTSPQSTLSVHLQSTDLADTDHCHIVHHIFGIVSVRQQSVLFAVNVTLGIGSQKVKRHVYTAGKFSHVSAQILHLASVRAIFNPCRGPDIAPGA